MKLLELALLAIEIFTRKNKKMRNQNKVHKKMVTESSESHEEGKF
jgi:hypothetical protein